MQKADLKKLTVFIVLPLIAILVFVVAKQQYANADFGNTFGTKATAAEKKLLSMQDRFTMCASLCNTEENFLQSVVFPEVMRHNTLKDDIESESLKVLYVQFGKAYADFSVGIFQMKPSFAEAVEIRAKQVLSDSMYTELALEYEQKDEETTRQQRLARLLDEDWQLIYLSAFTMICDHIYSYKKFASASEKLQWYATVYNVGFDKTDTYITKKIKEDHFYLDQQMPGKKFRYAAIATWFYEKARPQFLSVK